MSRTTYKMLKGYVASHNENWSFPIELSVFNDYYHILDGETHGMLAVGKTPGECWEIFYAYRSGYVRAIQMIRDGKLSVNK